MVFALSAGVEPSFFSIRRFAREFLVQHGGVVGEGGEDGRGLFEILGLDAIKNVGVRMVRAAVILDWIDRLPRAARDNSAEIGVRPLRTNSTVS